MSSLSVHLWMGGPVTSCSGMWILPLGPLLVRLVLGQGTASRSMVGSVHGRPVTRYADRCDSSQVPGRAPTRPLGGFLCRKDWPQMAAKRGWNWVTGLFQGPRPGLRSAVLPLGAWTGMSLTRPLTGQDSSWSQATGTFQDLQLDWGWRACYPRHG